MRSTNPMESSLSPHSWLAVYSDNTTFSQELHDSEKKYNSDLDFSQVKRYFLLRADGGLMCGVDLVENCLVINGWPVYGLVPEGNIEIMAFKRVSVVSDGTCINRYCLGVRTIGETPGKQVTLLVSESGITEVEVR